MSQPKSFTLDGKRHKLSALVPAWEIKRIAQRWHVSMTDEEVRADIEGRATAWPANQHKVLEQAVLYAIACHRANQKLYRFVMMYG